LVQKKLECRAPGSIVIYSATSIIHSVTESLLIDTTHECDRWTDRRMNEWTELWQHILHCATASCSKNVQQAAWKNIQLQQITTQGTWKQMQSTSV